MRWLAPAVVALTFGLSACGGGDDDGGADKTEASPAPTTAATTPAPVGGAAGPSKAKYIRRVDRICRATRAKLVPIQSKIVVASKAGDPDVVFRQYAALTGRAASVYTGALGEIRAIDAPPADQAQIDMQNALLAQIADIQRQNSAAAAAHDSQRLKALNVQATAIAGRYRSAAKAYGFRECGQTVGALDRRGNR